MADAAHVGLAEDPDVWKAKPEMFDSLRQAAYLLDSALDARDRIPTGRTPFFFKMVRIAKDIHTKAEELVLTDPHDCRFYVMQTHGILKMDYEAAAPYHVMSLSHVEMYLGKMIDFVFGQPAHPRYGGAKQAILSKLDPHLFIFLSFTQFPVSVDGKPPQDIWTDEIKPEHLPYLIRVAKEYLEGLQTGESIPDRWIFGKNFQITIANRAHLDYFADFRKAYHKLEF